LAFSSDYSAFPFMKAFRTGPFMITEAAVEKNKSLVHDALSKGANLAYGHVNAANSTKTA
jgi:hypothetical protein